MITPTYLRHRFHGLICFLMLFLIVCAVPAVSALQQMSVPHELIPSLEERVKEGDPNAAYALALAYYRGQVKPFDAQRMIQLAQDAVIAGNDNAALLLTNIYTSGHSPVTENDPLKGSYYMARFLYRGNPVGDTYQGGSIIWCMGDRPCTLVYYAEDLLESAASAGYPVAIRLLGCQPMVNTKISIDHLCPYFELAAQYGDPQSISMLAFFSYYEGDKAKARELLQEAMSFGDEFAYYQYVTYFLDLSNEEERDLGIEMLTSIAERGYAHAQRSLGNALMQYAADENMRAEGKMWLKYAESALGPMDSSGEKTPANE